MTTSNRGWNRILLIVAGLAWLAAGAVLVARQVVPDEASRIWQAVPQALADGWASLGSATGLELGAIDPAAVWPTALVVAAVVALVVAIAHATTRGRGRTSEAAVGEGVAIETGAVEDVFRDAFGSHPDVLRVRLSAWRHRGDRAWRATVDVRQHARLDEIADRAAEAAAETRRRIGLDAPVVVHLATGVRAAMSSTARVV